MRVFYIDGGSKGNERRDAPRKAKIAMVDWHPDLSRSRLYWKDVGNKTNSEAEYMALIQVLRMIAGRLPERVERVPEEVEIRSDSEFLVKQMNGEYKVREPRLQPMWQEAQDMKRRLGNVRIVWVPREENRAGLWMEGKWEPASVEDLSVD